MTFNDYKKLVACGSGLVFVVMSLVRCGHDGTTPGTANLKIVIQKSNAPALRIASEADDILNSFTAPTNVNGFNCYAVNVTGPGIGQSAPPPPGGNILTNPSCSYPGVLSQPISITGGTTSVNLPVPTGAGRLVQMLGVVDSTTGGSGCSGGQPLFQPHVASGGVDVYELGRTIVDVFANVTASITDTYATLTTATQQAATQANCGGALPSANPSASPSPTGTPYAVMVQNTQVVGINANTYYWPLNDGSPWPSANPPTAALAGFSTGTPAYNFSCAATNTTSVTGFNAVPNGSLYWNGASSDCMVATTSGFNLGGVFTIEFWFYGVSGSTSQPLFYANDTTSVGCTTYPCQATFTFGPSNIVNAHIQGATSISGNVATIGLANATWHYIALTFSGTGGNIYADTNAPIPYSYTTGGVNLGTSGHIYLGWDGVTSYLTGAMESVAIYNKVLDAPTIQAHYNRGMSAP